MRLKSLSLDNRRRLPPLPTILLANAQSIRNKVDELEALVKYKREIRETCLFAFTETWLSDADWDEDPDITGKSHGGGVCLYINRRYYNTIVVRERLCTPDIELLTVSLRPHYLPQEFQQLFFTIVYIHPKANVTTATQLIAYVTHRFDSICTEVPKFLLGDFDHCSLDSTLKTYEQLVQLLKITLSWTCVMAWWVVLTSRFLCHLWEHHIITAST